MAMHTLPVEQPVEEEAKSLALMEMLASDSSILLSLWKYKYSQSHRVSVSLQFIGYGYMLKMVFPQTLLHNDVI